MSEKCAALLPAEERSMSQGIKYARYHFKRYRDGKLMAEGASAEARTLEEALEIVKGWYSYADSFKLECASHIRS